MKKLTLTDFDDRLMDGFVFCRKVYALLEQVYAEQGGVKRLRLRDRVTKKLTKSCYHSEVDAGVRQ